MSVPLVVDRILIVSSIFQSSGFQKGGTVKFVFRVFDFTKVKSWSCIGAQDFQFYIPFL